MQRANLHGQAQIVVGDATSHVEGSNCPQGDQVTCPLCAPHLFEIAEGMTGCQDFGQPMALEGHKTTCDAVLIAQPAPND
ncbi:PAAR domain-containing protein [Burkholderia cepacia]|uniref:PAAR domain-containing protein n=1 Tax=Burkholderia cepacia TaxID=292 RepID=UPI000F5ADC1B|nr:PAAR domain-containing protein [Burkholderia cepacia]RQT54152.1 PAAR domain-containing protein [Burkholderia cepacia]